MSAFRPLRLQKAEETAPGEITLTWGDGRINRHNYRELRLACQCAVCRDEFTGRPLLDPATVPMDVHPEAIEPVGGYALRFIWSDGHATGMFPYDFLHREGTTIHEADEEKRP